MKLQTVLCLVAVLGCQPVPPTPPAPSGDDCERAYQHLGAVGCEPSRPESGTWADVCRNARQHGLMPLGCINRAATFQAADACGVNCAPK